MNTIKFVAIIVLTTKSTYCLVPRNGDLDYGLSKALPISLNHHSIEMNERPVYDPGDGKLRDDLIVW